MNLPNLNDVEIPKRLLVVFLAIHYIKDIENIYMAGLCAGLVVVGILCQTWTDVKGKNGQPR